MEDIYAILGVPLDATEKDIKKAFMKKAMKFHPDKAKDEKEKEAFSKLYTRLQDAYKILMNKETRKIYNASKSQGTFSDMKHADRDTKNYSEEDIKRYHTDGKFDPEKFQQGYGKTRLDQEEYMKSFDDKRVGTGTITSHDVNKYLKEREDLNREVMERGTLFEKSSYNREDFNAVFEHFSKRHKQGLEEYDGDVKPFSDIVEMPCSGVDNRGIFDPRASGKETMESMYGFAEPSQGSVNLDEIDKTEVYKEKPLSSEDIQKFMEQRDKDTDTYRNLKFPN